MKKQKTFIISMFSTLLVVSIVWCAAIVYTTCEGRIHGANSNFHLTLPNGNADGYLTHRGESYRVDFSHTEIAKEFILDNNYLIPPPLRIAEYIREIIAE